MNAAPRNSAGCDAAPAYRREVDRETVGLLRQMGCDNARIVELLQLMLAALVRIEGHAARWEAADDDWPTADDDWPTAIEEAPRGC